MFFNKFKVFLCHSKETKLFVKWSMFIIDFIELFFFVLLYLYFKAIDV